MSIEPDRQEATRKELADVLRELRKAYGLSGDRLAARCGMSQSKISRIERGRFLPSVFDVERILTALEVPTDRARELLEVARAANIDFTSSRALARIGTWRRQLELKTMTESTNVMRQFLPAIPTALVQTLEYARCVMQPSVPSTPERDVEKLVDARMQLRSVIEDESRKFVLLMTEQAIRWNYAGRPAMARQVAHTAREARRPNVDLAVIPHATKVPEAPLNVFVIYDERLVQVEIMNGIVSFRDPRDITYYLELFEFFYRHALTGEEAIEFLTSVADDFAR